MQASGMHRVSFDSICGFAREDLVLMTRALDRLLGHRDAWPPGASELVYRGRGVLEGYLGAAGAKAPAGPACRAHPDAVVDLPAERLLDVAADLLDAAGLLSGGEEVVDGFALEGIQARLLEALLGAGRIEAPASWR